MLKFRDIRRTFAIPKAREKNRSHEFFSTLLKKNAKPFRKYLGQWIRLIRQSILNILDLVEIDPSKIPCKLTGFLKLFLVYLMKKSLSFFF